MQLSLIFWQHCDLVLAFCVYRAQFFHMEGHFTKKCFYFMIFDCYKLKLSVLKNWQLFSNFNTRQFWSQTQLKTNWAHFFEHKEHPQCANIWQSLRISSTVPIPRVFFFFLTRRYSCIACWECVEPVSTLSQCSCHWFSDNTFGVKLDLVCHVIYPTHC